MNKRHLLAVLAAFAAGLAGAQDFPPKKPVTLLVGFAPGGAADGAARMIAKRLGENIGQSVVVENKAGAGGNIAHQQVAQGPADGSLLLLGSIGPLTIAPHMMKLPYDALKDLAPVSGGVYFPSVLVVNAATGPKTLAEFVALARKQPGSVSYASTGPGSASHLTGELFAQRIGADMVHVPYRGGSQAMPDLLAGRFTGYFAAPPTALPHIETGKVLALATTGPTRPPHLPNVPTVAESGYPGFQALNWYAFVAPAKVPAPVLDRWNQEIVKVLREPEMREYLTKHGLAPHPTTRAELGEFIRKESAQWGAIVRERKIVGE
ncbi:MAG TPA: tripartite tricarboxylate transporter substrate binding protein [Ramlibacter sp.]|jgi:tripartite-type tricarboxylate transporter receptor subunit TctC|uniref:Bug family tripartite tricarboxylate transporter substrate binding protein n=1 Tax=Ramlibacter sp. TaxID=1917967 RepID=UPI002D2EBA8E|nr:tripartite tricarboxylate transporter substrate binding protein [Ramlibacter sp.]HZY17298.1 tripartite tricarboxylate transporter substrate binding protein [Ramlibacter sp.]